jgi:hypothetical protein
VILSIKDLPPNSYEWRRRSIATPGSTSDLAVTKDRVSFIIGNEPEIASFQLHGTSSDRDCVPKHLFGIAR